MNLSSGHSMFLSWLILFAGTPVNHSLTSQRIMKSFAPPSPVSTAPVLGNGRPSLALSVLSTPTNGDDRKSSQEDLLPAVEFVDPKTKCQVVLLGCFHGTKSSSQDVAKAITPETNVVVMELCQKRFEDLREAYFRKQQEQDGAMAQEVRRPKPWILAYFDMIVKAWQQRGIPTALASAVLGGFTGLQTALSGFTPGLEFTTALEKSMEFELDIVLADQDVDETLRKVGSLPQISLEMNTGLGRPSDNEESVAGPWHEWQRHSSTLQQAILGHNGNDNIPQVQLGQVLLRNSAAIQDLVRLTIPPTLLFYTFCHMIIHNELTAAPDSLTWTEELSHVVASFVLLTAGYVGLALPAVRVILTERDEILTDGIQKACERAGEGGRVVAVLGLLHVNGIARRMIEAEP